MSQTLDVSKVSGWLNADACCAESKGEHAMREDRCGSGGVRALGGGDAIGVHGEGPTQGCVGARARAERTKNISRIV